MNTTGWRTRLPSRGRRPVGAFQLLVGFGIGILLAFLVLPAHSGGGRLAAGSGTGSGAGRGADVGPGSTDAGLAGTEGSGASAATGAAGAAGVDSGAASAGAGGSNGGGEGSGVSSGAQGGPGAAAGGAAAPGVTAGTIKVDVVYADLGALRALGPAYDNGNVPQQWQALIDGWHRQGLLPVNGRDIQLVFHSYNVLSPADQRSACIAATQDDKAFLVVGVAYFQTGAECVAREYHTPLITFDGPEAPAFERSYPYLFSIDQASDRLLDNFVYWAQSRGALVGHRIGLYYANDADTTALVNRTVKAELAHFGYKVAAEATTGDTNGGPEDAVAVQRFRAANVDLALLFTSKTGFMQAAQAQGYRPTYLESDFLYGTADVTTSTYPSGEFDGTYGITTQTGGMQSAGIPPTPGMAACVQNYERYSGQQNIPPTAATYGYILISCDEGTALLTGLERAGRNLTVGQFVSSLESLSSFPLVRDLGNASFDLRKHDGANLYRTVQWRAKCSCWVALGNPAPLWIS